MTYLMAVEADRADTHLTIRLIGELDCATAGDLADQVAPYIGDDERLIRLELSEVTFCGSAGITLFIQLHNQARERGFQLLLCAPSKAVMRTLKLCRLHQVLCIEPAPSGPATRPASISAPGAPAAGAPFTVAPASATRSTTMRTAPDGSAAGQSAIGT